MRFSEFSGKEIIDLNDGERIGIVGQTDLIVNPDSGHIDSMVLPASAKMLGFGKTRDEVIIPWTSIRKIGPEMIIIERKQIRYISE
ncbi:MAG: YlmC/YmxH family sporulation protein [Bacilli bacterium]